MIKILLLEDEAIAARKLSRMLDACKQDIEVLDIIESKKEGIQKIPTSPADLILMDIHLTDGKSFDILEAINCSIPIIFTTAYDQYTLRAFKHLSIDYLLKPIAQEDLQQALDKYEQHFKATTDQVDYQQLAQLLQNPKTYKNRFLIQIGSKLKPIGIEEVAYFYSKEKTTYLSTIKERNYPIEFTLTQLEQLLDPREFYRVNRQFLIARKAITDISYFSTTRLNVQVTPKPAADLFVSIDKIVKFKNWLR